MFDVDAPAITWQEQAEALFFIDHIQITEIASVVGLSRKTISKYLNECDGYEDEMTFRKQTNAAGRKEYQRQWDKDNRPNRYSDICGESLRREHDLAAIILSKDRY